MRQFWVHSGQWDRYREKATVLSKTDCMVTLCMMHLQIAYMVYLSFAAETF